MASDADQPATEWSRLVKRSWRLSRKGWTGRRARRERIYGGTVKVHPACAVHTALNSRSRSRGRADHVRRDAMMPPQPRAKFPSHRSHPHPQPLQYLPSRLESCHHPAQSHLPIHIPIRRSAWLLRSLRARLFSTKPIRRPTPPPAGSPLPPQSMRRPATSTSKPPMLSRSTKSSSRLGMRMRGKQSAERNVKKVTKLRTPGGMRLRRIRGLIPVVRHSIVSVDSTTYFPLSRRPGSCTDHHTSHQGRSLQTSRRSRERDWPDLPPGA